ncbi:Hg(II)-responsive transcriptional regulator, partial [Staphylococcus sp. 231237_7MaSpsaltlick]
DIYEFVSQKVDEVQQQIRDLMRVENMLNDLKECCPNEEYLYSCPIIEKMFEG